MYLSVRTLLSKGNTAPESISLIHLIKVGEEIAKFRSVRNLNENAQIEQYKLDKILKDLDADVLMTQL
jgi:predicted glycosyltransferase